MTDWLFAVLMLFSVLILIGRADATATKRVKPNRVFILADDPGGRDLGVEGSTFYESRSLDRIANSTFHSAHES